MRLPSALRRISAWLEDDPRLVRGLLVALVVRLALLPWFSDPLNFWGFHLTTSVLAGGWNPWVVFHADPALAHFNPWGYPPLFLVFTLAALALSFGNGVVFGLLVRLPLVAADLVTGGLLFRIARLCGRGRDLSAVLALAYWFNPFVLFISVIWGTMDALPVLCVAGALYYALRSPPRADLAALSLGIGIAFKLYPAVLVPVFLGALAGWKARVRFLVLAAVPLLVSSAPVLLASPGPFLTTLASFTYASAATGTDQNTLYAALGMANLNGLAAAVPVLALFAVLLIYLGMQVRRERMHLVVASTVAVLGIFLAAPRYNANYFLWPVSLVLVSAALAEWPSPWRHVAVWAWLPLVLDALLYNGSFGITGLAYWSFVSLGRSENVYAVAPTATHRVLGIVFLACVAASMLSLWLVSRGRRYGFRWPVETVRPRVWGGRSDAPSPRGAAVAVAVGVILFLAGSAVVIVDHQPVAPGDFGAYAVSASRVSFSDGFRSALLGFTWSFQGTGEIALRPAAGILFLDTLGRGGTAWIERRLPQTDVAANVTLSVDRVDGPGGILSLVELPEGRVAAVNTTAGSGAANTTLEFLSSSGSVPARARLGFVRLGAPFTIGVDLSPGDARIEAGSASVRVLASGQSVWMHFGTSNATAGGGRVAFQEIAMSWPTGYPPTPLFGVAVIALSAAVLLAVPVLEFRDRRKHR